MKSVKFRDSAGFEREGEWGKDGIRSAGKLFDPDEIDFLPPVAPTKIVGVGSNYHPLAEGRPQYPEFPRVFFKPPHTVSAHDKVIEIPNEEVDIVHEPELAVVIGKQCRNVKREEAAKVVRGYTCMNDITRFIDRNKDPYGTQRKGFDNSAPLGPVVATPDQVPEDASIKLYLNGQLKQDSSISEMVYSIDQLIEKITQDITLEPGDVIATGTPPGVGPISDNDEITISIEGIGTLRNKIVVAK